MHCVGKRYRRVLLTSLAALFLGVVATPTKAEAVILYLSFQAKGTFAGTKVTPADILQYDTDTGISSLFFDGSQYFTQTGDGIDAFDIQSDGTIYLSTHDRARLIGVPGQFGRNDVIHYNPATKTGTVAIDGAAYFKAELSNIDVIDVLPDGSFLLSSGPRDQEVFAGLTVGPDDIFRFDPLTGTASLFFDGDSIFKIVGEKHVNIDAFDVMSDGRYLMSLDREFETLKNGTKVNDADLVVYNPATGEAGIFLDHHSITDWKGKHRDIEGVDSAPVIPEPMSFSLFGLGLAGLSFRRRVWF